MRTDKTVRSCGNGAYNENFGMLKVLYTVKEVPTEAAGRKKNTKEVDLVAKLFDEMCIRDRNITPYITSSIIMQLLTIAIPKLEEMQRDGEEGLSLIHI